MPYGITQCYLPPTEVTFSPYIIKKTDFVPDAGPEVDSSVVDSSLTRPEMVGPHLVAEVGGSVVLLYYTNSLC